MRFLTVEVAHGGVAADNGVVVEASSKLVAARRGHSTADLDRVCPHELRKVTHDAAGALTCLKGVVFDLIVPRLYRFLPVGVRLGNVRCSGRGAPSPVQVLPSTVAGGARGMPRRARVGIRFGRICERLVPLHDGCIAVLAAELVVLVDVRESS